VGLTNSGPKLLYFMDIVFFSVFWRLLLLLFNHQPVTKVF